MSLSLVFQFSVYAHVLLSSLIYGLAEGAPFPAGLTLPIAIFSLSVIDLRGRLRIPQWIADGLGLVAFFFAGAEFFGDNVESRLLAGAHLLIYLTWVVLIQQKSTQQYWRMIALGMLQVAVAAVLTQAPQFGLLLILYVFFALWTLTVYSMYRAELRFMSADNESRLRSQPEGFVGPAIASGTQEAGAAPTDTADRNTDTTSRWIFHPSTSRGTIQHDPEQRFINSRFVLGTFAMANASIVIGTIFFLLIPRLWFGRWQALGGDAAPTGRMALTGFSEQVELGSMGEILESSQLVMKVRLTRVEDDLPVDVEEFCERLGYSEPLFRGSILAHYSDRKWNALSTQVETLAMRKTSSSRLIRQIYQLEPIGTDVLFCIQPAISGHLPADLPADDEPVHRNPITGVITTPMGKTSEVLEYVMFSEWPETAVTRRPVDVNFVDPRRMMMHASGRSLLLKYLKDHTQVPTGMTRTKNLAQQIAYAGDAETKPDQAIMAERIEAYLRNSGTFTYSLDTSLMDPKIDPVEDFLFNRKQGHCQYFASALALMLRTVGIPTRLVNGFKGGMRNEATGQFEVQQRHAHTWVEALIDDPSNPAEPRLKWVVYDPTPSARDDSVKLMDDSSFSWASTVRALNDLWANYFVQLSLTRQTQEIYAPIQASVRQWWKEAGGVRGAVSQLTRAFVAFLKDPGQWISWKGGFIAFLIMATTSSLYWLAKKLYLLFRYIYRRQRQRLDAQIIRIEFYERFVSLLSKHGMHRQPAQTQREFADEIVHRLQQQHPQRIPAQLPGTITSFFYQCRFGLMTLTPIEIQSVEQSLAQLEQLLATPVGHNGHP
ncbi:MAG: DUF3488 and transglutaminase-like domain-containing protein [Planctomycetaceae bacterium]